MSLDIGVIDCITYINNTKRHDAYFGKKNLKFIQSDVLPNNAACNLAQVLQ